MIIPESPIRLVQDDDINIVTDELLHTIECNYSTNYNMVFNLIRASINILPEDLRNFVIEKGKYSYVYVSEDWYYMTPIWGSELELVNSQTPEALMNNPESYVLNSLEYNPDGDDDDEVYPFCFCTRSLEKVFWHRINTYPLPLGQEDDYDPDFDHSNWE